MRKVTGILVAVLLTGCSVHETTRLSLPSVINSGMVLQRNTEAKIWGTAGQGQKVNVEASWGAEQTTRAGKDGRWKLSISTTDAGGPYEIVVSTKDTSVVLNDILLGEVWLCSGQSNMEMPVMGWPPNDTVQGSKEAIAGAKFPEIRLFTVGRKTSAQPLSDCSGHWVAVTPETVADFSATAYFFGREIHQKTGLPVGLIHSSWGGTPAEAWTSAEFLKELPSYKGIEDSIELAEEEFNVLVDWIRELESMPMDNKTFSYAEKILERAPVTASPTLNDSDWLVIPVPSVWEANVLPNFDGIVWYRKEFQVPEQMIGSKAVLKLGPIDDMDAAFINGQKVGAILEPGHWKEDRIYSLPPDLLKKGENTLAVCVIDNQGGGGIYGNDDVVIESAKGGKIVLSGDWKCLPVAEAVDDSIYYFTDEKPYTNQPKVRYPVNAYTPTMLFNAMIHPLVPFTLRGVIWYQGEANVGRGYEYRTLFPALINSWRTSWGQGDFPFYYVQIAPWMYWDEELSPAAEVREAQLMALSVPNTGMVVTTDIGNPENIHPANKQEVGERLARWALAKDYGFDSLVYSGPLYDSISIASDVIKVFFDQTDGGLIKKGDGLTYFELAGNDQIFHPAKARINGKTVEVWSGQVPEPVAVRFGWSAIAEPNLFNAAGLPASPFRSDSWKRLSE